MSVFAQQFEAFLDHLRPTPDDHERARAAAVAVAAILRRHYRPDSPPDARDDHLIAGSFGKRTAVRPLPAVDLFYLLPERREGEALADLLAEIYAALTFALVEGALTVAGDCVRVDTSGGVVAATPAFRRDAGFRIPVGGAWRTANPVAESAAFRLADAVHEDRASRLLALLKAWKTQGGVPLPSFALEIMVREFLVDEQRPGDFEHLLSDFFAWSRRRTPHRFDLPGGLDTLLVDDSWHGQAESAYWRCILAARHAAGGDAAAADEEWRHLFGPDFPAALPATGAWAIQPDLG